ncbi:MBOAT family protein [Aggregicoccus sp. 17bor-14]|uniref:MBOAT family O-acyltransferase n=1 Tax=Myxococcaceae TaxID=31 RepID=UPI0012F02656|nr:MBOAT family protein [Simulacricoccus sp. 17bor-14]MRI91886.1 MBOAT family protein [Aggregicoccus sp. 17bor-14]
MSLQSLPFLVFLGASFALYWAVHRVRWARLGVLLLASLAFYAVWTPLPLLLLVPCCVVDHLCVRAMSATQRPGLRRALMVLAVGVNLAALCTFKYGELFRETAVRLLSPLGVGVRTEPLGLLLPLGLSFFCFQAISYVVDVYRGEASGRHSFPEHLLYLLFFPRVVAGPIVRARDLLERFRETPTLSADEGAQALFRITLGLVKKLVVADVLGAGLVDSVFANPHGYTSAECLVAAVAYSFELYFDFSGYSDMALGAAALFGFRLPENFARPYLAKNLFEFWNRWHMTLSSWLRDYLYRPMGGSRVSRPRVLFNLLVVMALGGLWHGSDWRFAVWGGVHGLLLCLVRVYGWARGKRPEAQGMLAAVPGMLLTFSAVVLTRVVFRAQSLAAAGDFYRQLLQGTGGLANVGPWVWGMLAVAALSHASPLLWRVRLSEAFVRLPVPLRAVALVAVGLGIRHLGSVETRPYVYLKF